MDTYLQFGLIGLISGSVGFLIGKIIGSSSAENKIEKWRLDLENCEQKSSKLQAEIHKIKQNSVAIASDFTMNTTITFDAKAAKVVFGKSYQQDDLKIIEGIGPKIEELFKTSGILTWKALGETSVDRLREILSKAGDRFQMHDPGTWPKQSKLAHEGKWQELKDWQNNLEGGREV